MGCGITIFALMNHSLVICALGNSLCGFHTMVSSILVAVVIVRAICFNCEELGQESCDCESAPRCCNCKSTKALACCCPHSWFPPSRPSAPDVDLVVVPDVPDLSSGGHVAASADDPPSTSVVRDPSSDGNVAAPASDHCYPSTFVDFLHTTLQHLSDLDILWAAEDSSRSSLQPSDESSSPPVVNSQGFISEQVADCLRKQGVIPNPPGPQST